MKKILIIGGGIAGISAGIFAQKAGYSSEIYEKNSVLGGQCMGWNRDGHHIDNCIHWLTGTKKGTELYELWKSLGALDDDISFIDQEKFYSSELNGKIVILWKNLDKTEKELLQFAPEDLEEIRKFISDVRLAECCEMPVSKPMDMMNLIDYIHMGTKMKNMGEITKEYGKINIKDFANRFQNPLLRKLFTDYMPTDYIAANFIVSYATITSGNGSIPAKGSLAMANRMIHVYKSLGGIIHNNCTVKKILIKENIAEGFLLENDTQIYGDYVISATDTSETFHKLLSESYIDKHLKRFYENRKEYPVFSSLQMAFSIDDNILTEHTLFFDCEPINIGKCIVSRISIKAFQYEPSFAPKGKTVLQVNIPQNEENYLFWKSLSPENYIAEKKKISASISKEICRKYPLLKNSLSLLDCWTPLTYEKYCNSYNGSYMAFIKKPNAKCPTLKGNVKGIPNLFIASQWLMSPGGLPTAAATGKFAIQRILKKEKKSIYFS